MLYILPDVSLAALNDINTFLLHRLAFFLAIVLAIYAAHTRI